ncbi:MAG: hypothetical protein OHK0038_22310 [Flammeovirgaceae bacterium]
MANKLHELLAVEQDRKNKANQVLGEIKNIFTKKDPYFDGMIKKYLALDENSEQIPDENKEIVMTVKEKVQEMMETVITAIDTNISKEETNASNVAKADLIVGEENLGTFSATSLLSMESHLTKLKELYECLPVLDPTRKWSFDAQKGVFRTDEEVKFRSIKQPKVIVKYEATKEHPAQTELLYLDQQIGKYETTYFSGKITPTQKSEILKRIDKLLEAVKIARSKANNVEVNNVKVGKKIFDFIHKDIF